MMGIWSKKKSTRLTRTEKQKRARIKKYGVIGVMSVSIIGIGAYGTMTGSFARGYDYAHTQMIQKTAQAGFHVNDVLVTGRDNMPQDILLTALNITAKQPIFNLPINDIQDRLAENPWVEEVSVSRRLPDKVVINITERVPVALWQYQQKISVIDAHGHVLTTDNMDKWGHLPLLVGAHAATSATDILALLYAEPDVAKKITSAVRIGERRWDLHMDNGMIVKLPENDVELALRQLSKQQKENQIFEKNFSIVDLRIPDKLVVRGS